MTKNRKAILRIVEQSPVPLSASEIYQKAQSPMDLATVYRSLKFFEDKGILESFSFTCIEKRTERYYYYRKEPHAHFFHCEGCHRFIDMGQCQLETLVPSIEKEQGVRILSHTLYFTGLCGECLGNTAQAH